MPLPLDQYQTRVAQIRDYTTRTLAGVWGGLGSWRDADVERFARIAVPKVQAAQIATARATAAYLGGTVSREEVLTARRVDRAVEYLRPANVLWTALSEGATLVDAVTAGTVRLTSLIETDVQLAKTVQSRASLTQGGHQKYRRVLSGAENCAICVLASGNLYSTADLMPIHDHCDCSVAPAERVEAVRFDVGMLAGRTAAVDSRGDLTSDYADLVAVNEHSELGPQLSWAGQQFTELAA
jgi:hypothetical protein